MYRLGGSRDTPQVDAAVDGETVDGGKLTSGELEVVDGSDVLLQLGHVLAPINTEVTRPKRATSGRVPTPRSSARTRVLAFPALEQHHRVHQEAGRCLIADDVSSLVQGRLSLPVGTG